MANIMDLIRKAFTTDGSGNIAWRVVISGTQTLTNLIVTGFIQLSNNIWIKAVDFAGTGFVNMFRVNVSDEIEVGATLDIGGGIEAELNSGEVFLANFPVDGTPAAGTPMSWSIGIDSEVGLRVLGIADGIGGISNLHVLRTTTDSITADVGSAQGGSPLTTDNNEISVCANVGDSVTLPTGYPGMEVYIVNNGANAADVFPASGEYLNGVLNTAIALAVASNVTYVCYKTGYWEAK